MGCCGLFFVHEKDNYNDWFHARRDADYATGNGSKGSILGT